MPTMPSSFGTPEVAKSVRSSQKLKSVHRGWPMSCASKPSTLSRAINSSSIQKETTRSSTAHSRRSRKPSLPPRRLGQKCHAISSRRQMPSSCHKATMINNGLSIPMPLAPAAQNDSISIRHSTPLSTICSLPKINGTAIATGTTPTHRPMSVPSKIATIPLSTPSIDLPTAQIGSLGGSNSCLSSRCSASWLGETDGENRRNYHQKALMERARSSSISSIKRIVE